MPPDGKPVSASGGDPPDGGWQRWLTLPDSLPVPAPLPEGTGQGGSRRHGLECVPGFPRWRGWATPGALPPHLRASHGLWHGVSRPLHPHEVCDFFPTARTGRGWSAFGLAPARGLGVGFPPCPADPENGWPNNAFLPKLPTPLACGLGAPEVGQNADVRLYK